MTNPPRLLHHGRRSRCGGAGRRCCPRWGLEIQCDGAHRWPMPKLIFTDTKFAGQVYRLMLEKTTVGRGDQNILVIRDDSVSSKHCVILVNGPEVIVRELRRAQRQPAPANPSMQLESNAATHPEEQTVLIPKSPVSSPTPNPSPEASAGPPAGTRSMGRALILAAALILAVLVFLWLRWIRK